jgi:hypothetical protein
MGAVKDRYTIRIKRRWIREYERSCMKSRQMEIVVVVVVGRGNDEIR